MLAIAAGLVGAPALWFAQMLVSETLASTACYPLGVASRAALGNTWAWLALIAACAFALATACAPASRASRHAPARYRCIRRDARRQYALARCGMLAALGFVIGLVFTGIITAFVALQPMALIPILNLPRPAPVRAACAGPPRRRRARCACGACGACRVRSRAAARRTTPRAPTMRRNPRRRLQSPTEADTGWRYIRIRASAADAAASPASMAARASQDPRLAQPRRRDARLRGSLRTARDSPMPQPAARPSRPPPRTPTPRRSRAAVTSRTPATARLATTRPTTRRTRAASR